MPTLSYSFSPVHDALGHKSATRLQWRVVPSTKLEGLLLSDLFLASLELDSVLIPYQRDFPTSDSHRVGYALFATRRTRQAHIDKAREVLEAVQAALYSFDPTLLAPLPLEAEKLPGGQVGSLMGVQLVSEVLAQLATDLVPPDVVVRQFKAEVLGRLEIIQGGWDVNPPKGASYA